MRRYVYTCAAGEPPADVPGADAEAVVSVHLGRVPRGVEWPVEPLRRDEREQQQSRDEGAHTGVL